jgi:hypothetical protein
LTRIRIALLAAGLLAALTFLLPSSAGAYRFGETVTPLGPEQMVFDWSTQKCEDVDIPDNPARAFKDVRGRIQQLASHFVTRRNIGYSLTSMKHDCRALMRPRRNTNPAYFEDRTWVSAPYTEDGRTIYALAHNEYQGWLYGGCVGAILWEDKKKCWTNDVTLVVSTDAGDSWHNMVSSPHHLVATAPYPYQAGAGPFGIFNPSSIVKSPRDGYYYAMVQAEEHLAQKTGMCLMRTRDLADPKSWRAWNGRRFGVRFIDPYTETTANPADHVCEPVSPGLIEKMGSSVTWSTHFNKFLLIGMFLKYDPILERDVPGIYYSTSRDMISWSDPHLIMEAELAWTFQCGDQNFIHHTSALDPNSPSRSFDISDDTLYLYFVVNNIQYNAGGCFQNLDRDMYRVAVKFTGV